MKLKKRLNEIIDEKDSQIEELQSKLEELNERNNIEKHKWQLHENFEETEFDKLMPYPRIEMRFKNTTYDKSKWYNIEWKYGIVHKYYVDTFNKDKNILTFIPLSITHGKGGDGSFERWLHDGKIDLPFRDGVHIKADMRILSLPGFITCQEKNIVNEIDLTMADVNVNSVVLMSNNNNYNFIKL